MTKKKKPALFAATEILTAEYEYIAQTAFQANEDRARVTTFYLVSVGSLFGAFFGTKDTPPSTTYWAFSGLFLFLSYFGVITLKQLIQLRKAWFESAAAMNQIKDFIIEENENLSKVFRWKTKTLPDLYKPKSVAYLLAHQVITLDAVIFSAMIFYMGKALGSTTTTEFIISIIISGLGGFIFLKKQNKFYRTELSK